MSDIIKDAKKLLDGATPGPWEWVGYDLEQTTEAGSATVLDFQCATEFGLSGAIEEVEITPEDETLIAAAPELAAALAQETWEYSVQEEWVTPEGRVWRMAADAEWHPSVRAANASIDPGAHSRIVGRRVSPPEVINE